MTFMGSESQLLTWQGQGLPSDTLSGQNALAILHGVQTPFIIDPSSQVRLLQRHPSLYTDFPAATSQFTAALCCKATLQSWLHKLASSAEQDFRLLFVSMQAIDWLRATIKASGASCEVVAQHDPHFLNSLELAVRFGTVRHDACSRLLLL
jgi:hypothetical protein